MRTRHQRYAALVADLLTELRSETPAVREIYKDLAQKLPVLVHEAGLARALAFAQGKAAAGADGSAQREAWKKLLSHLAQAVESEDVDAFVGRVREAELGQYMYLTREVGTALLWFKRLSQALFSDPLAPEPVAEVAVAEGAGSSE